MLSEARSNQLDVIFMYVSNDASVGESSDTQATENLPELVVNKLPPSGCFVRAGLQRDRDCLGYSVRRKAVDLSAIAGRARCAIASSMGTRRIPIRPIYRN